MPIATITDSITTSIVENVPLSDRSEMIMIRNIARNISGISVAISFWLVSMKALLSIAMPVM